MKKIQIITFLLLSMFSIARTEAQNLSIKTSMTQLALMTPNLELGFGITKKISLHLPVLYNPWVINQGSRFQRLSVMPGVRFWQERRYFKTFISAYAVTSRFNIGGWFKDKYRYDGTAFGAGVGFGYALLLGKHWNLDMEIGLGLVKAKYDRCGWQETSIIYKKVNGLRIAPTKLDISAMYFF